MQETSTRSSTSTVVTPAPLPSGDTSRGCGRPTTIAAAGNRRVGSGADSGCRKSAGRKRRADGRCWHAEPTEGACYPTQNDCSDSRCTRRSSTRRPGRIRPITLVSDNGPCFKAARCAAFIDDDSGRNAACPAALAGISQSVSSICRSSWTTRTGGNRSLRAHLVPRAGSGPSPRSTAGASP